MMTVFSTMAYFFFMCVELDITMEISSGGSEVIVVQLFFKVAKYNMIFELCTW